MKFQGLLSDGTIIAVKQLSSKSKQGNREFVNEIGMVSALEHPHLVKLYGCCIASSQLLLVYEYMENNSLARALYGKLQAIIFFLILEHVCTCLNMCHLTVNSTFLFILYMKAQKNSS